MSLNSDPIADMIARIKNALEREHEYVDIPFSKFKLEIIKVLVDQGFIKRYAVIETFPPTIKVLLKYKEGEPVIHEIKKFSKPGRRVYRKSKNLPKVINGIGIAIISTSHGVMDEKKAERENIGGEVICTVY